MVGIAPGERRRLINMKANMNVPANKMIQTYSQAVEVPQGYFGTSHRSREQPQASVLTFESTPQADPANFGDFSGISTAAYLPVAAAAGATQLDENFRVPRGVASLGKRERKKCKPCSPS